MDRRSVGNCGSIGVLGMVDRICSLSYPKVRGPTSTSGAFYENGIGSGGRPHGLPPLTVSHGTRFLVPVRRLLRVSTNSTGPSTRSKIEMSAGGPAWSVPRPGTRLMILAGSQVV